jgi:hypothetical protein
MHKTLMVTVAVGYAAWVSAAPPGESVRVPHQAPLESERPAPHLSTLAWIHGLPDFTGAQGLEITLAGPAVRKPGGRRLTLVVEDGAAVVARFAQLRRAGAALPSLRIVERKPGPGQNDTEYRLTNVRIVAADAVPAPAEGGAATQQVILGFERIEARMGVSMNPGPPPGSMPVAPSVVNAGWLYGLSPDDDPVALAVGGFEQPAGLGEVRVRLAAPERLPRPLETLLEKGTWPDTLILVLPDVRTLEHREFKLHGGRVARHGLDLVFRSDDVEILGTSAD